MVERWVVALVTVFSVVALALVDTVMFSEDVTSAGVIVTVADALDVIVELVGTLELRPVV